MPGNPYYDDVLLHIKMNGENNSTTFTDLSKYARTVTAQGNAKISTTNPYVNGSSGSFNGTTSYLTVNPVNTLSMPGDFTIEWFANQDNKSGYRPIIDARAAAAYQNFILGIWDGKIDFVHASGRMTEATQSTSLNTWTHGAVVRSGTTLMSFVGGVKGGTTATLSGTISCSASTILINKNVDGYLFSGLLADLRITNRALWTANFTPPSTGLPSGPLLYLGEGTAKFTDGAVASTVKVWSRSTGALLQTITPNSSTGNILIAAAESSVDISIFKDGYRPLTHGPITLTEQ